jgi:NTE family protein
MPNEKRDFKIEDYSLYIRYATHLYEAGIQDKSFVINKKIARFSFSVGDLDVSERCYLRAIDDAKKMNHIDDAIDCMKELLKVYRVWGRYADEQKTFNNIHSMLGKPDIPGSKLRSNLMGDRGTIGRDDKQDVNSSSLKYTVSEGSNFVLDPIEFLSANDLDINNLYTWKQIGGEPISQDDQLLSTLSFTAPYVKGNYAYDRLSFELTVKDNKGKIKGSPYTAEVIVRRVQRAMIFQGGGALGAYESGVYKAIVEKLIKEDEGRVSKGLVEKRPLFDIVAGTSIGAMNAAIVVSSVSEKGKILEDPKNWEDSYERVRMFWRAQKQFPTLADLLDIIPFYNNWWDAIHNTSTVFKQSTNDLIEQYLIANPAIKSYTDVLAGLFLVEPDSWKDILIDGWYIPSTAEARRRYYSAIQFLRTIGSINVATGIYNPFVFGKFFDYWDLSNWTPRPDNKHFYLFSLKKTLEQFAHFPIKTQKGQPRLLVVSVDVKTGGAVTFDSYYQAIPTDRVSNGIEIEHVLASGTFPNFFDYPKFKIYNSEIGIKNEEHIFWDGGFRSNTPLREVIQAHRDYWYKTRLVHHLKQNKEVPDLEIYIADLWPSEMKEDPISFDVDFVENRKWDLLLGDKTDYDEQVANVVTDYVDLAIHLKNLAERKGASDDEINQILDKYATSVNTKGHIRQFKELLGGRFRLTKVVRIDYKDDGNDVAVKAFDYSQKTIEKLMRDGYRDGLIAMDIQRMRDGLLGLVKRAGHGQRIQNLLESFNRIQEYMKVDAPTYVITSEVKTIIQEVESMQEKNDYGLSLQREKAFLIDAANKILDLSSSVG